MGLTDLNIRLSAFNWLAIQSELHPDGIPRTILENEFEFNGERITLIGAKGIWKPRQMELPISMTTIQNGPYADSLSIDGFLKYNYRGQNPYHQDNIGLRKAMLDQIPLIYFLSIAKGRYVAEWPVFIIEDSIHGLYFTVDVREDKLEINANSQVNESLEKFGEVEKSYKSSKILVRLHQKTFRERVLKAYNSQCSFCKLKHRELLDAAHIITDKQHNGDPIVQNGISLCKIHHAAFDNNFIGITPDYSIKVRKDVLKESDGPMLRFGIQDLNGKEINLPDIKEYWPDKDRLHDRFQQFLCA